ncbi:ATP synthase f chain, mitochondrial precursor [Tieghemiomyces parasiticus]|uniref:ATP synthase f chain, mitochondrial n=1 Tax=Tieghemiomyces parasiticus TaxID=78921 RepID=A0A9W8DS65_9FUNG|nr:ATP synthase f chain, mitochondrial precursor [Tieghemiomyces parasiticus]
MHPILRRAVLTRGYATARDYIPPSLAGARPAAVSAEASVSDAAHMERVVGVYQRMPKGPAVTEAPKGLVGRYRAKYVDGENSSIAPLFHVIAIIGLFGYTNEYLGHLRKL